MKGRSSRAGYSLLELITVIGIAGVTASLALPGLSYVKERRGGEYDAEYISGKLRQLRMETLQANISVRLDIVPSTTDAGVYRLKAYSSPGHIGRNTCRTHSFTTEEYDIEWDLKSGYHVYADTDNGLCYYPGGGSSGGSIYVTNAPAAFHYIQQDTTGAPVAGDDSPPPAFPYLTPEQNPRDFELAIAPDSVRARVDIPLATGIPDVVKTFVSFSTAGTEG